jgi:hypothetical protein
MLNGESHKIIHKILKENLRLDESGSPYITYQPQKFYFTFFYFSVGLRIPHENISKDEFFDMLGAAKSIFPKGKIL